MSKSFLTLLAVSVATLGLTACGTMMDPSSPTNKAPGTYKSSTTSTSPNGTTYKTNETTNVYKGADGNKKAVVKTETTKDPEGMFNKSTSTSTKSYN